MSSRFASALFVLVAGWVSWPNAAIPDNRRLFVIIAPPPLPQPAPQHSFPIQPPLQWAPAPALGAIPGRRSPPARCYAGDRDCPLEQTDRVGKPCSCGGALLGRALIPPSHDISGKPAKFD